MHQIYLGMWKEVFIDMDPLEETVVTMIKLEVLNCVPSCVFSVARGIPGTSWSGGDPHKAC